MYLKFSKMNNKQRKPKQWILKYPYFSLCKTGHGSRTWKSFFLVADVFSDSVVAKWSCWLQACACGGVALILLQMGNTDVGRALCGCWKAYTAHSTLQCQERVFPGTLFLGLVLQHLLPGRAPELASIVGVFYQVRNCQAACNWQIRKSPQNH